MRPHFIHFCSFTEHFKCATARNARTKKITLNELIKLEESPRIQVLLAVTTMILAKEVGNPTDDDDEKEREERE
jgi:hypothetical protein|tara:strand:+ start:233 stop:454 length:222 start_codon:yes stop_codon:yes gene_type:complete